MKKSILISLILSFIFIFNIHNEAFATSNRGGNEKSFSVDSLMKNVEVDFRLNYGFFIHHHFEMTAFSADFPMFELSLQKQTYGKQSWQSFLNYPTIGITAFYSNLGNVDIIGKAYAIYPFIDFPFNKSKINTFGFRFGVGVGYLTEKFHPSKNIYNSSIGAYINAAISLTFEYKRHISERFKLSAFAGLTHFSNGCSNFPNSGINIINAGVGTTYLIKEKEDYIPKQIANNDFGKIEPEYYAGMSMGVKRIKYEQNENIAVFDLEFYAMDRISNLSKLGIAADLVYNRCSYIIVKEYYNKAYSFVEMLKPGIGLAYELTMGEASFLINFGYHLYGRDMRGGRWYQKLGFKVNIGNYAYAKIALNTHFGIADFIGWGVGIRL